VSAQTRASIRVAGSSRARRAADGHDTGAAAALAERRRTAAGLGCRPSTARFRLKSCPGGGDCEAWAAGVGLRLSGTIRASPPLLLSAGRPRPRLLSDVSAQTRPHTCDDDGVAEERW